MGELRQVETAAGYLDRLESAYDELQEAKARIAELEGENERLLKNQVEQSAIAAFERSETAAYFSTFHGWNALTPERRQYFRNSVSDIAGNPDTTYGAWRQDAALKESTND